MAHELALTHDERNELARCEQVIAEGQVAFVATGRALARIRDGRLYRETHDTFDDYAREMWQMARSRAYQLVDAAAVSTMVDTPPRNERQARALVPLLDEPDVLRAAWSRVVDEHGDNVTAVKITRVVDEYIDDDAPQRQRRYLLQTLARSTVEIGRAIDRLEQIDRAALRRHPSGLLGASNDLQRHVNRLQAIRSTLMSYARKDDTG